MIELHVHVEGAIPLAVVAELARENHAEAELPSFDWRRPGYRWETPAAWRAAMRQVGNACLRTPGNYARALDAYLDELADQGAIYAEPSVTLEPTTRLHGSADDLLDALTRAASSATAARGIDVGLLVAIDYATEPDRALELVKLAAAWRDQGVVGIDLHGAPVRPMADFGGVFAAARDLGLGTRVHAGEFQGPRSVRTAVETLGARRVAHGVRAVEDPALLARLAAGTVALDLCPGGNVSLGVAPSLREHPVRRLFDAGVPLTVSTDDPLYFSTSLADEHAALAEEHGFTVEELLAVTRTAALSAFAPAGVRARLLATVEAHLPAAAAEADR